MMNNAKGADHGWEKVSDEIFGNESCEADCRRGPTLIGLQSPARIMERRMMSKKESKEFEKLVNRMIPSAKKFSVRF